MNAHGRASGRGFNPNNITAAKQYLGWVNELARLIPQGGRVLDLGCGCGVPATKALVEHGFDVTGVDFSVTQIERAQRLVPGATFVQTDMTEWQPELASFDAIVSFYALIHVPLADQKRLIPRYAEDFVILTNRRWKAETADRLVRSILLNRCPPCSAIASRAIRTARSRGSGGYRFCESCVVAMLHPHFQGMEWVCQGLRGSQDSSRGLL